MRCDEDDEITNETSIESNEGGNREGNQGQGCEGSQRINSEGTHDNNPGSRCGSASESARCGNPLDDRPMDEADDHAVSSQGTENSNPLGNVPRNSASSPICLNSPELGPIPSLTISDGSGNTTDTESNVRTPATPAGRRKETEKRGFEAHRVRNFEPAMDDDVILVSSRLSADHTKGEDVLGLHGHNSCGDGAGSSHLDSEFSSFISAQEQEYLSAKREHQSTEDDFRLVEHRLRSGKQRLESLEQSYLAGRSLCVERQRLVAEQGADLRKRVLVDERISERARKKIQLDADIAKLLGTSR